MTFKFSSLLLIWRGARRKHSRLNRAAKIIKQLINCIDCGYQTILICVTGSSVFTPAGTLTKANEILDLTLTDAFHYHKQLQSCRLILIIRFGCSQQVTHWIQLLIKRIRPRLPIASLHTIRLACRLRHKPVHSCDNRNTNNVFLCSSSGSHYQRLSTSLYTLNNSQNTPPRPDSFGFRIRHDQANYCVRGFFNSSTIISSLTNPPIILDYFN